MDENGCQAWKQEAGIMKHDGYRMVVHINSEFFVKRFKCGRIGLALTS